MGSTNIIVVWTDLDNCSVLLNLGLKVMMLDMGKMVRNVYGNVKHHKNHHIKYLIISSCKASRSEMISINILIIEAIGEKQGLLEVKMLEKH